MIKFPFQSATPGRLSLLTALTVAMASMTVQPVHANADDGACLQSVQAFAERIKLIGQGQGIGHSPVAQEIDRLTALGHAAANLGRAGQEQGCHAVLEQARNLAATIEQPVVLDASRLTGLRLIDRSGELIGNIDELIVDPVTGRIAYGVIRTGGLMGMGERRLPVPWALLSLSRRGDGMIAEVPRERLLNGPQLAQGEQPDVSSRQWAMAIHTYYNTTPYWLADNAAVTNGSGSSVSDSTAGLAENPIVTDPLVSILRDSPAK